MKKNPPYKQEHSKDSVINIYAILAILIVIIPEWIAEIALSVTTNKLDSIEVKGNAWNNYPALKLSSMNLIQLRNLARKLRIHCYSSENKETLTKRILKKLKRRRARKLLRNMHEWNTL